MDDDEESSKVNVTNNMAILMIRFKNWCNQFAVQIDIGHFKVD